MIYKDSLKFFSELGREGSGKNKTAHCLDCFPDKFGICVDASNNFIFMSTHVSVTQLKVGCR